MTDPFLRPEVGNRATRYRINRNDHQIDAITQLCHLWIKMQIDPSKIRIGCLFGCVYWILLLVSYPQMAKAQSTVTQELVRPSQANPAVSQFDEENVVLTATDVRNDAPLAIFLPGTHGKPMNSLHLMNVVASQGYRVIGLSYNDVPAAVQTCPNNPNPECYARFRDMRTFGRGPAPVSNSYDETIEARLVALLRYLDQEHPRDGWSQYLTTSGQLQWSRILVSGLSQGAGMAAYIAKLHRVYRVVLFSSPWDNIGRDHRPAPWLYRPSATPPDLWWAERHARENTTELIANAYRVLQIPSDHIMIFNQGLVKSPGPEEKNPFHPSTIQNPAYEAQWRVLYGMVGTP
jgi:hypothetical protein